MVEALMALQAVGDWPELLNSWSREQQHRIGYLPGGHTPSLHGLAAQGVAPATPKSESIVSPMVTLQGGRPD